MTRHRIAPSVLARNPTRAHVRDETTRRTNGEPSQRPMPKAARVPIVRPIVEYTKPSASANR